MIQLISMFLCGALFMFSICAILVMMEIDKQESYMDTYLEEQCLWYEAEYGKESDNG